MPLSSTIKDN